ncbi:MAG: translation initiation factor IF-2 subunit beta [Methanobacteriota archaeon]|jgi:translation initiation factor 2 subunit 2|nr:MAG: translation initiation factor IF-2 subunit beta [Euryarchaeota archaeon]RPJ54425.1 MAG: translation initiation factor IF-2 subunit beta [Euryarchaeota archaeon]
MAESYEDLLKKAYTNIKVTDDLHERFVIPVAKVFIEGKTTVLENFFEIADKLSREPEDLLKYLLGEIGTAGKIEGSRAIFNGKFEQHSINAMIRSYVEDYVICSECGRPDTKLVKDGRVLILRCDACGGHRPVKKRKARIEEKVKKYEEGSIVDLEIQSISRKGDGVVRDGKYTIYVANSKPGQKVQVKIARVAGSIVFTERL